MLTDLNTSVATISSDELDRLFEGTPVEAVNANSIQGGVRLEKEEAKPPIIGGQQGFDVDEIDLDNLPDAAETPEEGADKDKTPEAAKTDEEVVEDVEDEDKEEDKDEDFDKSAINAVLKNTVDYLVSKGIFQDFDGREDMEIDEETYAELAEKQFEAKLEEGFRQKKEATGEYGQAIIDHIEKGGNPDELIDLFKEAKAIQQLDLSDDESRKDLIVKWYKEQHNWSDGKVKKFVDALISESDEALETEATEILSKYEQHHKAQLDEVRQRQAEYDAQQKEIQRAFETNITKAIDTHDVDDNRKRMIKDAIFKFKDAGNGKKVNDFYVKFAEWQSDPAKYIELAEFVLDKEGYLKRQTTKVKNEVADKTFNFVKGNAALNKNRGSKHVDRDASGKSKGIDFSSFVKR